MSPLKSYEDWKHCITVLCRVPITPEYIDQRLSALRDPSDYATQRFIETWGEPHLARIIDWFEQAKRDLG